MPANPIKLLTKPEFFWRPRQVLARLSRIGKAPPAQATIRLPWGAFVHVYTGEHIGSDIYYYGIFDKIVPEAIWRLLDASECAVEVGANIGQNSTLMAFKAGRDGRIWAFEPHPEIFLELKATHERSKTEDTSPVQLENLALGELSGEAVLTEGGEFSHNRGSAALQATAANGQGVKVKVRRLDDFLQEVSQVGVCKIDVEGHELSVLRGAEQTLKRRAIRDIIFEDFNPKPSAVTTLLEQHGYTLFELHHSWLKPQLAPVRSGALPTSAVFSYNFLATLDVPRAKARFQPAGWRCLLGL